MNATLPAGVLVAVLPGPDRKQTRTCYRFRVVYRAPRADETGCMMVWEVTGGREPYQIALERDESGRDHWHCTCADAVYRGELTARHRCKHVRGLLECTPPRAGA